MPVPLQFSRYVGSPDCPVHSYPTDLQRLLPGRVLPPSHLGSQPARAASDSERVTVFPTRYPPSVSTDRPGTGSDRIWVRSFANTALFSSFALSFQLLDSLVLRQYFRLLFLQESLLLSHIVFTLGQFPFMLRNLFFSGVKLSCSLRQFSSPIPFLLLKLLLLLSHFFFLLLPICMPFLLFSFQRLFCFQ